MAGGREGPTLRSLVERVIREGHTSMLMILLAAAMSSTSRTQHAFTVLYPQSMMAHASTD